MKKKTISKTSVTALESAKKLAELSGSEAEVKEASLRRLKPDNLSAVLDIPSSLPNDFMQDGRNDLPPQERDIDL